MIRRWPAPNEADGSREERTLRLDLGSFAWQALEQECERFGVTVEELTAFALMYYLADADSGRVSRRLPSARVDERES